MTRFTEIRKAILAARSDEFTHSRCRQFCGQWSAYFYVRANSPTGVALAASIDEPTGAEILKRCGRTSPLSPTEGY